MTTQQYVKKFQLDNPELTELHHYDIEGFIAELGKEFTNSVEMNIQANQAMGSQFTYSKYLHLVKSIKQKFESINNKKVGLPLPDKVFSKFFAIHVIKLRTKYFAAEQEKADRYRKKMQALELESTMKC